jgi:hypothetical protein
MCELLKPYVPEVKDNAVTAVRVVFRYTLANARLTQNVFIFRENDNSLM